MEAIALKTDGSSVAAYLRDVDSFDKRKRQMDAILEDKLIQTVNDFVTVHGAKKGMEQILELLLLRHRDQYSNWGGQTGLESHVIGISNGQRTPSIRPREDVHLQPTDVSPVSMSIKNLIDEKIKQDSLYSLAIRDLTELRPVAPLIEHAVTKKVTYQRSLDLLHKHNFKLDMATLRAYLAAIRAEKNYPALPTGVEKYFDDEIDALMRFSMNQKIIKECGYEIDPKFKDSP